MKHIFSLFIVTILLVSCGGEKKRNSVEKILESNDLNTIRTKRAELVGEQDAIHGKIKLLDQKMFLT